MDEPGDLHVSSLPEDLDGAFQKREDSGVRDVSRRLSFWYGSFSGGKILSFGSMPVRFCSSEFSQMQSVVQAAGDTADLLIASGILSEICHHAGGETVYVLATGHTALSRRLRPRPSPAAQPAAGSGLRYSMRRDFPDQ